MHTHDDRYYTESEIDNKLSGKSDTTYNHDSVYSGISHNHDNRYYTESEINTMIQTLTNLIHAHYSNNKAVNIETILANYSRDSNFIITFTNNETTGDLVNTTGKHLFIIRHTCGTNNGEVIEEAFAIGNEQIATRTWQWWLNSYTEWFIRS